MLHQLLSLTRPLFVIDTETTGTDTQRDRIVELGFQHWDANGLVKEWRSLVNPGVPIPTEVIKIHGITNALVTGCKICQQETPPKIIGEQEHGSFLFDRAHEFAPWPKFNQLAANLAKGFTECDFAGQNVRFDLRITAAEMARSGVSWSYGQARVIDSSQLERLAIPRSLTHLHEKYVGYKHDGAHGALSDVRAVATVLLKQLETHEQLPRNLDELHRLQWPGWIDPDGKFQFINGIPCFSLWGKFAGRPMREADNGYWDYILSRDFSADVKALASAAKLGKYPQP